MIRKSVEIIHVGRYAAEVPVDLTADDNRLVAVSFPGGCKRLDAVRLALRKGEIAEAVKYGRVFKLTPILA